MATYFEMNSPYSNYIKKQPRKKTYAEYINSNHLNKNLLFADKKNRLFTDYRKANLANSNSFANSRGLLNSGYFDYLKSKINKNYQNSLSSIDEAKELDASNARLGFKNYLFNYMKAHERLKTNAENQLIESNSVNIGDNYKYLKSLGLDDFDSKAISRQVFEINFNKLVKKVMFGVERNKIDKNSIYDYGLHLGLNEKYAQLLKDRVDNRKNDKNAELDSFFEQLEATGNKASGSYPYLNIFQ